MSPVAHKPPVKKKPGKSHPAPHKHPAKKGKSKSHPSARKVPNAVLEARSIHPKEKNPYKSIPAKSQGPGKLTGGQHITLQAWTVKLQVTVGLGEDGAKLTSGYGSWQEIAIPRGDPFTQWQGRTLLQMDIHIMIDGWHKRRSVEQDIQTLENLATRRPAMLTPPSIRIFGAVPHAGKRWVISGMDYGDALRSFHTGHRLRQEMTLHLMEFRAEEEVANMPRAKATPKPPRHYKVKKGDTLKSIATKMLGKSSKWHLIAKANKGMRGWKLPQKWVGKTIKVPPK